MSISIAISIVVIAGLLFLVRILCGMTYHQDDAAGDQEWQQGGADMEEVG